MKIAEACALRNGILLSTGDNCYAAHLTKKGLSITRVKHRRIIREEDYSLRVLISMCLSFPLCAIISITLKVNFLIGILAGLLVFILISCFTFYRRLVFNLRLSTRQFHTIEHKVLENLREENATLDIQALKKSDWFSSTCSSIQQIHRFYHVVFYTLCLTLIFPHLMWRPKDDLIVLLSISIYIIVLMLIDILIEVWLAKAMFNSPLYKITRWLQKRFHYEPTEEQYQFGLALGRYILSTERTR